MLRTLQIDFFVSLLFSWLLVCSPASAFDLYDMPAEVGHPREVMPEWRSKKNTVQLTKEWNFGLPFRIESLLCQKFQQANCPSFAENQECRIEFDLVDNSKIKNVRISSHSKDPSFDTLSKKLVLNSAGSPELKLSESQRTTTVSVSSTFYKAEASRWVVVSLGTSTDKSSGAIPNSADSSLYGYKKLRQDGYRTLPWPKDRQVIQYENENGETRFKLVPVDNFR